MKELKIVATVVAKSECDGEVYAALTAVVDATRTESGNISYVLTRDTQNPLKYVILEHWSSQEALASHAASDHFQALGAALEGKTDGGVDVVVVTEIY